MTTVQLPKPILDTPSNVDVWQGLQTFYDHVAHGTTIEWPDSKRFRCEKTLVLPGKQDITDRRNGSALVAETDGDRTRSHNRINNCTGVLLEDAFVVGPHEEGGTDADAWVPAYEAQAGVEVLGSSDVTVARWNVRQVYGDFGYTSRGFVRPEHGAGFWRPSTGVRFVGGDGQYNGRQGLTVAGGVEGYEASDNLMRDVRRAMFDIEIGTTGGRSRNIAIRRNWCKRGRLQFVACGSLGHADDVWIEDNLLEGMILGIDVHYQVAPDDNPPTQKRLNWHVNRNHAKGKTCNGRAIRLIDVDGGEVNGNYQKCSKTATPLVLWDTDNVTQKDNQFPGAVKPWPVIA